MGQCSNCGMGFYHPEDYRDHLPCESKDQVIARLTRERDEALDERDSVTVDFKVVQEQLDDMRRERDEARAAFLACAEAIGVAYEPDDGPSAPGPLDKVVEEIRLAVRFAEESFEARAEVEKLRAQVATWERNAAYACENPAPQCDCPGCSLARADAIEAGEHDRE